MNNILNLDAINEAFGATADLYRDVLGVKANASSEQIQRAYFERRNELFQLLAELEAVAQPQDSITATQRFQAERKMDAVVMTLRILGDQGLRSQYDDIRAERISKATVSNKNPPQTTYIMEEEGEIPIKPKSVLKKSSYHISVVETGSVDNSATAEQSELTGLTNETSPSRSVTQVESPDRNNVSAIPFSTASPKHYQERKSKRKARRVSPDQAREGTTVRKKKTPPKSLDDSIISSVGPVSDADLDSLVSEGSLRTFRTMETSLTTYETNRGYFQAIQDEIMGALDDTSQSFHQVFSVFTLREDEIDAVAGRIEKARRQMINSFSNK